MHVLYVQAWFSYVYLCVRKVFACGVCVICKGEGVYVREHCVCMYMCVCGDVWEYCVCVCVVRLPHVCVCMW